MPGTCNNGAINTNWLMVREACGHSLDENVWGCTHLQASRLHGNSLWAKAECPAATAAPLLRVVVVVGMVLLALRRARADASEAAAEGGAAGHAQQP